MMRQGIQHKVGEEVYFDKMIGHWHSNSRYAICKYRKALS